MKFLYKNVDPKDGPMYFHFDHIWMVDWMQGDGDLVNTFLVVSKEKPTRDEIKPSLTDWSEGDSLKISKPSILINDK